MAITEKSKILIPVMENIPEELKLLPQFVIWKAILNEKNEYTKVPFRANGIDTADTTNRNTWETFADVEEAYLSGIGDGIGFVLSKEDPYACIDIDGIEDLDNLSALNLQITNASYTEISPSGSGLHVWIKGYKHDSQKFKNKNTKLGYEIYDNKRFLTLTGESKNSLPISGGPEIEKFINMVFKREESKQLPTVRTNDVENNLTESDIIRIATNSKTGARFNSCFNGGWESSYSSQSEADMAFCNDLAFWTGRNYRLMDSIFRQSALMREKWDRRQNTSTYGDETLKKAINECTNVFSPKKNGNEVILSDEDPNLQVRKSKWWAANGSGSNTLLHNVLGLEIMQEYYLVRHPNPHSDLYYYNVNKGIYEQDKSGRQVSAIIRNKDDLKRHQVREVQEYVTDMSDVINHVNTNFIAVDNGLLNLNTFELEPFSPSVFVTQKINTAYNPNANDRFIEETLQKATKGHLPSYKNICEMFACVLYPKLLVPKMFYLYGKTAHNGKSSVLNMIFETFDKNGGQISAVSPQSLATNKFAGSSIYGKLANVVDDQPDALIEDSGMLKTIITGGRIEIERKGKDSESVKMSTPLITASNYFPNFRESGNQINRRLHIIPFEYSFTKDENCVSDSESMQRIASESAREYVLKLAVDALKRMLNSTEADKLTYNEKSVEVGKLFAEQNDPLSDYFFEYDEAYFNETPGTRVLLDYENWCKDNRTHPLGAKRFKEAVGNHYNMEWVTKRVIVNGHSKTAKGFKSKKR